MQGKMSKPVKLFITCSHKDKNYIEAYNNRGLTYHERDKFGQAIEDFNQAIGYRRTSETC